MRYAMDACDHVQPEIANIFNNYFSTIAAKTKSKIKFQKKQNHFSDFWKTKNLDTILIYPAT